MQLIISRERYGQAKKNGTNMIELIRWFHDLLRDKGTKWFTKLFFVFIILFIVYSVDDHYGWSYYSRVSSQVQLLKDINECLKDSTLTQQEKDFKP
jgi:3',5'-cyclic AMP phosphodiesterase CpdA